MKQSIRPGWPAAIPTVVAGLLVFAALILIIQRLNISLHEKPWDDVAAVVVALEGFPILFGVIGALLALVGAKARAWSVDRESALWGDYHDGANGPVGMYLIESGANDAYVENAAGIAADVKSRIKQSNVTWRTVAKRFEWWGLVFLVAAAVFALLNWIMVNP